VLLPWYACRTRSASVGWLKDYTAKDNAPALLQALKHGRVWLLPIGAMFVVALAMLQLPMSRLARANGLLIVGAAGFSYFLAQGFAIGAQGWAFESLTRMFGPLATGQYGMGWGARSPPTSFAMLFALGLAESGSSTAMRSSQAAWSRSRFRWRSSPFSRSSRSWRAHSRMAAARFRRPAFFNRLFTAKIWNLGCFSGGARCGVAWNTLLLALLCAAGCTALGSPSR
jgi:iron(III) transport system permease protein